jgi:hypothetical protein
MKILDFKNLNEDLQTTVAQAAKGTGINQKNMRSLVKLNMANAKYIGTAAVTNTFRLIGFSFVTQQSYNNFLQSQNPTILDVKNNFSYHFATYYEGDSCYLYPYDRQDIPLLNEAEIKSYLKLDLYKRADVTIPENVEQYFASFNPKRSEAENENNVKNYKLEILPEFSNINKKHGISNPGILNLPFYVTPQEPYYISFNIVSKESSIDKSSDSTQGKYVSFGIKFATTITSGSPTVQRFNTQFDGNRQATMVELQTTSMLQRLINPPATLATTHPYVTVFTQKGTSNLYYIYTQNKFNTYPISNNPISCYIGLTNSEFLQATFNILSY